MNRRRFIKGALSIAALAPGFSGVREVERSLWAQQLPRPVIDTSNAVIGFFDADDHLLAMGGALFQPASQGRSKLSLFCCHVERTGVISRLQVCRNGKDVLALSAGTDSRCDVNFNSTSAMIGDRIEVNNLLVDHETLFKT